jgi:serine protease Do
MFLFTVAVAPTAYASDELVRADALHETNVAIKRLVERVSPSVVQIVAIAPRGLEDAVANRTSSAPHSIGSGVIVDPGGYIVTNEHVVAGADEIDVIIPGATSDGPAGLGAAPPRMLKARLVGVAVELDLALLSVDATGLPALPWADYDSLRQGELVFAFGSPDGLRDSVTMGIVSAVARQADPDSPLVYIQTDAAINPGNSGGPLVNVDGQIVGLNTFIATASGGSEGLGFALPSAIVSAVYPQLRASGRVRRASIGVAVQTLTPMLAAGLGLSLDSGLLVSDVMPGGPADGAGLRPGDVITAIDGSAVDRFTFSHFYLFLFGVRDGQEIRLTVRRGTDTLDVVATAVERSASAQSSQSSEAGPSAWPSSPRAAPATYHRGTRTPRDLSR